MSRDARNSLIAWGAVLAMCGLFWLGSKLDVHPPPWLFWAGLALMAINLLWDLVRFVRARVGAKARG